MSLHHDPMSDFLTRIRNAIKAKKANVAIPSSNLKVEVAKILKKEGFINGYKVEEDNKKFTLIIALKYEGTKCAISTIKAISKPGLKVYAQATELPRPINGLGIAIISTSKGLMTNKAARLSKIGGEVLAYV